MQAVVNALADEAQRPIAQELDFLIQRTGQDELTLLSQAMRLGLGLLYRQAAEQAFIDEVLPRAEAVAALGPQRVAEIEYAKQALAQDVRRGLGL
jgi:hypothetical protein